MIDHPKFTIGDTTISVKGDLQPDCLEIPGTYRPFIKDGKTDITLRLHAKNPAPIAGEKIFESPPIWSLYRHNGTSALRMYEHIPGLVRTLVLPRDIKYTDLYFDDPTGNHSHPFYGPTITNCLTTCHPNLHLSSAVKPFSTL